MEDNTVDRHTIIAGNRGDDTIAVDSTNQLGQKSIIVGGTGNDQVQVDATNRSGGPQITGGVESPSVDQTTIDNILEEVEAAAAAAGTVFGEALSLNITTDQNSLIQSSDILLVDDSDFVIQGTSRRIQSGYRYQSVVYQRYRQRSSFGSAVVRCFWSGCGDWNVCC